MKVIYDTTGDVLRLIEKQLGHPIIYRPVALSAINDEGEFIGGALLSGYTGFDIQLSLVGAGSMTRGSIRAVMAHVFGHLNCLHMSAQTRRDNKLVRRLMEKFGFTLVCVLPKHFGPNRADDAFCYRLSKAAAERWI